MFQLLADPLDQTSKMRQEIARALLECPVDSLEATTKKMRKRFAHEWASVAATGQLPAGSGLHCALSLAARNLKLDAGNLESLNSMVKSAMASANNSNLSLQLLSARVNSRKMLSMLTSGSNRLKDVRPIAEKLATSSVVFQTREEEVLRTDMRYSPPGPKDIPANNVAKHNPAMLLSHSEKWAMKFNSKLLEAVRVCKKRGAPTGVLLGMLFHTGDPRRASSQQAYFLAEVCGRSCWTLQLEASMVQGCLSCHCGPALCFESSLGAIAGQHQRVLAGERRSVSLVTYVQDTLPEPTRLLQFAVGDVYLVADLLRTRDRRPKQPKAASQRKASLPLPDMDAESADDSNSDVDGEARATHKGFRV